MAIFEESISVLMTWRIVAYSEVNVNGEIARHTNGKASGYHGWNIYYLKNKEGPFWGKQTRQETERVCLFFGVSRHDKRRNVSAYFFGVSRHDKRRNVSAYFLG